MIKFKNPNDCKSSSKCYKNYAVQCNKQDEFLSEIDLRKEEITEVLISVLDLNENNKNTLKELGALEFLLSYKDKLGKIGKINQSVYSGLLSFHQIIIRSFKYKIINRNVFAVWSDLIIYLQVIMSYELTEQFRIIFLDSKFRFKIDEVISKGTIDQSNVHIREIIAKTFENNSKKIIIIHNHPSGDHSPSKVDKEFTRDVLSSCKFNNVEIVDHLIISKTGYFSFRNSGMLYLDS